MHTMEKGQMIEKFLILLFFYFPPNLLSHGLFTWSFHIFSFIGKNTLRNMVRTMCAAAGITGYKTNPSLRATTCTLGLQKGVPEKMIMERSGHRSVKSLHAYQRVTKREKEMISDVLQGNQPNVFGTATESTELPAKKPRLSIKESQEAVFGSNCNFHNCSFVFNVPKI